MTLAGLNKMAQSRRLSGLRLLHCKLWIAAAALVTSTASIAEEPIDFGHLAKLGTVDERYQSYNIEMVEVTGGRFWAPWESGERYRTRPPLDLSSPRIVALAKALGPAYLRVSGTWANTTYVPAAGETVNVPPAGYKQVLSREQWSGVIAFAKAVDAKVLTSFAASEGVRDPDGSWNPAQAQRLLDLTREVGGSIYAAELFNEPTMPQETFPKGYGAANYARDFRIFHDWARTAAPNMKLMGPGGVSEGTGLGPSKQNVDRGYLFSEDLLKPNPGSLDLFVYHFYGGVSARCLPQAAGSKDEALTAQWLDRTLTDYHYYAALRDKYEPGKPIWLNETAQAACGGSPWASTFLDSFRYLNQLGALAQQGVQMVAHNTLAASDYALVDYDTMVPRPNYWAAVLWSRTMGQVVLAPPASPASALRLYAHCLPRKRGGVGLLALNIGATSQIIRFKGKGKSWLLTGDPLDTRQAKINGIAPTIDNRNRISGLSGTLVKRALVIPAGSIAFVAVAEASNASCR